MAIGEPTREALGDAAIVRPLGTPQLKGKAVPVAVHELQALAAPGAPAAAGAAGRAGGDSTSGGGVGR